ncbi:MAG TPA: putative sulfate/molybdate transporter [Deltaproteobacteria bacterium]|nr:putative sulfate/molybdate transporter [Deltaproteobacteria bacterium]HOM28334.1 putative sulfate/molybdate transporter [Deltaproteobacteria bacterium]HPP79337.1 putative sulfate/molybdate transporter [Deltaproteobacteria bacterium]
MNTQPGTAPDPKARVTQPLQAAPVDRPHVSGGAAGARIRFNRNELAGAFGDMGTDIPLLIGVTLACGLDATSVLVMFGLMQVFTGLSYRMPMPVQPLKAMAAIVISQQVTAAQLHGAGLAIGLVMLLLALTGMLDWLGRVVPKCVIRGIQLGLGLQLAGVALGKFVLSDGAMGYVLALAAFVATVALLGNRRFPAALAVVVMGLVYAFAFNLEGDALASSLGFHLPSLASFSPADMATGFVVLALPQIPLSLCNSVLATRQLAVDLFPERPLSIKRIGLTYAVMNLVNPWFGGVPTCHGSGGMAGHFAFGGRTGGSVVIYGALLVTCGLFLGTGFDHVVKAFPLPMLGVLLLFEALALIWLIRDVVGEANGFPVTVLVGLVAAGLPYGYVIGLIAGTVLWRLGRRARLVSPDAP